MHPLVACVLLRVGRLDQFREDPQADPPDGKPRQPADGGGGKRCAVVGADDPRESVLPEEALEDGLRKLMRGGQERLNVEEVPGEPVLDGQGIGVQPVAGPEVPFEVGGPDLVGGGHGRGRSSRVRQAPPLSGRGDEAMALQDVADGGTRRPPDLGRLPVKEPQELLGAPVRMTAPGLQDPLDDRCGRGTGEPVRTPGSFGDPFEAPLLEPADPLVAGLATYAVSAAHFGQGVKLSGAVSDKQESLVHG